MIALKTQHRIEVSRLGAEFPEDLEGREWKAIWKDLQTIDASLNWIIGDWLNFGKRKFGEKYSFALDITQLEYQTLRNRSWICAQVPLSLRRDKLSWSHHEVVAPLGEQEQRKFLGEAEKKVWTVSDLRIAVRQSQATRTRSSAKLIGFVPAAWIAEGLRWFGQQDMDSWPADRREALRRQLQPLADFWERLEAPP